MLDRVRSSLHHRLHQKFVFSCLAKPRRRKASLATLEGSRQSVEALWTGICHIYSNKILAQTEQWWTALHRRTAWKAGNGFYEMYRALTALRQTSSRIVAGPNGQYQKMSSTTTVQNSNSISSNPEASNTLSQSSLTPVTDTIRTKLTRALSPTTLSIRNDSHLHAHHAAMVDYPRDPQQAQAETHFHVSIVSSVFESTSQAARHRMIYGLLKEELERTGGIHALQLKTKTPTEDERIRARDGEGGAKG